MRIKCASHDEAVRLARKVFHLAYNSSEVMGMGFLQARNSVTEEQIFENVRTRGDYPDHPNANQNLDLYADYVFGRMMKVGCKIEGDTVVSNHAPSDKPRADYQSWAINFKTYGSLFEAAMKSVDVKSTITP